MPQATIKLQTAPVPAAAGRTVSPSALPVATSIEKIGEKTAPVVAPSEPETDEEDSAGSEIPMPFILAAAAITLVAFGIQLWTFLS